MTLENKPDLKNVYFEGLFVNSPIGIFIVQNGIFRFVNPEFQKISGYTKTELLGMESSSLILDVDRNWVKENAVKMLKGEISTPYSYRAVDKSGEIKWIIESVAPLNYDGKRATLGYFMDNTKYERVKEAMKLSEEKFHKAFRSSPEWFVISTLEDGFYIDVNETFLRTTGYLREEVIGRTSVELGIWEDLDQRIKMVEILRKKGKARDMEVRFRIKSGEVRTVLWSAEKIRYGEEECLLAVTRDITHRKQVEQERLLREKLQGVLEMAGAACHELNQPLQIMFNVMDKLQEEYPQSDTIKKLQKQLSRMSEITNKANRITSYETKEYITGTRIIDIDRASRIE